MRRPGGHRFRRLFWPAVIAGGLHVGLGWLLLAASRSPERPAEASRLVVVQPVDSRVRRSPVPAAWPPVRVPAVSIAVPALPPVSWRMAAPPSPSSPVLPAHPLPTIPPAGAGAPAEETPAAALPAAGPSEPASSAAGRVSEIERYLARLRTEIQRRVIYPAAARRLGIEGEVVVRLTIGADGRPETDGARIVGGSEDSALREGALATLRRLGDLPAPPAGALTIDLPIRFSLNGR